MKILIVDDEYVKAQSISEVISSAEISDIHIRHESTAHAARLALRSEKFDIVLIDLHLPAAIGLQPTVDGGIEFFDIIMLDDGIVLPADVLFITAREDLIDNARTKVLNRGANLVQYVNNSDTWRNVLIGKLNYAHQRIVRNGDGCEPVDIAIITALRKPEFDSVLGLDYKWQPYSVAKDPTLYSRGSFVRSNGQSISVIAACAQRKGMPTSAALSAKLLQTFKPKYLVMLGICAGVPGKTNFGDVVVADPTWDWGSGKRGQDPDGSPVFLAAPYPVGLNTAVSQLCGIMSTDLNILRQIRSGWDKATPEGVFSINIGPMASGACVIADDTTARSIISGQNRELIALEMEAYAVMAAADSALDPKPISIAIKSVCDFADAKKDDRWQEYAAYTSAAFADLLFNHERFEI